MCLGEKFTFKAKMRIMLQAKKDYAHNKTNIIEIHLIVCDLMYFSYRTRIVKYFYLG